MKKRIQYKKIDDVVRGYVKEGITSYGSINLPNGNPGVKMGIRFKLATLYVVFDTVEGFYYFGKKIDVTPNILIFAGNRNKISYKDMKKILTMILEINAK